MKELINENERVTKKYSKLKAQLETSKSGQKKLMHDNKALQSKIKSLNKDKDDLMERINELNKALSNRSVEKVHVVTKAPLKASSKRLGSANNRIKQGG